MMLFIDSIGTPGDQIRTRTKISQIWTKAIFEVYNNTVFVAYYISWCFPRYSLYTGELFRYSIVEQRVLLLLYVTSGQRPFCHHQRAVTRSCLSVGRELLLLVCWLFRLCSFCSSSLPNCLPVPSGFSVDFRLCYSLPTSKLTGRC